MVWFSFFVPNSTSVTHELPSVSIILAQTIPEMASLAQRCDPASQEPSPLLTTPPVEQPLLPVITTTGGQEEPDPEVLRKTLFAFMQATLPEKRAMLHRTPLLLTPAAVTMLNEMAQAAQDQQTNLAQVMKFLADLLERVRQEGIDPVFDEGEHVLRSEVSVNLYLQWLSTPTYQDSRRFLQQHPEILTDVSETLLQTELELVMQAQMNDPQQQQEQVEAVRLLLYLFRDIRARVVRLRGLGQFSDDDSLTRLAILEGYVNWKGGFMLDLPAWLEKTRQKSVALRRSKKQLYETASSRATLWQKALKRAQSKDLAVEIVAEIAQRVWDALDDITANQSPAQEVGLQHLDICLRVYTEERYPYQWALIQNNLGATYRERILGNKAENLEQAIACYTAALRVYTEDTFSVDWAKTQNRLALIYNERKGG